MSASIVPQLIRKDLRIIRKIAFFWWLGGVASVVAMATGPFLFGMILFVTCLAGGGIHSAIQTVVEERREGTLPFIMSLPVTVRGYTTAKLLANLGLFGCFWLSLSGAGLVVFLGPQGMQNGAFPFVTVVLVGVLLAYTIVLATSLVCETIGAGITAIVGSNIATQLFLWWVADLEGIRSVIGGDVAVWNGTVLTVLAVQTFAIVALIALTYVLQSRKTDFI